MSNVDPLPQPGYAGPSPDEIAAARGEGEELVPSITPGELAGIAQPGGPTLERLWQLSNFDPFFYRNLVSAAGYIKPAWFASPAPPQIRPWIPPRPVPAYTGLGSSVGLFEGDVSSEFGTQSPGPAAENP